MFRVPWKELMFRVPRKELMFCTFFFSWYSPKRTYVSGASERTYVLDGFLSMFRILRKELMFWILPFSWYWFFEKNLCFGRFLFYGIGSSERTYVLNGSLFMVLVLRKELMFWAVWKELMFLGCFGKNLCFGWFPFYDTGSSERTYVLDGFLSMFRILRKELMFRANRK